ncbi:unnamed protein product, partial [Polarella glacialis]
VAQVMSSPMSPRAMALASKATQLAAVAVFAYEGYVYNVVYLGRTLTAVGKEASSTMFAVLFNLFFALAVWSYLRCYFTDPGRIPTRWQ